MDFNGYLMILMDVCLMDFNDFNGFCFMDFNGFYTFSICWKH